MVITDLGVLEPDPETHELKLAAIHPGIDLSQVRESTGWPLQVLDDLSVTNPPTAEELEILRDLSERTALAHSRP